MALPSAVVVFIAVLAALRVATSQVECANGSCAGDGGEFSLLQHGARRNHKMTDLSFKDVLLKTQQGTFWPENTLRSQVHKEFLLELQQRVGDGVEQQKRESWGFCPGIAVIEEPMTKVLLDKDLFNETNLGWWSMPVQQSSATLAELRGQLTDLQLPFPLNTSVAGRATTFSKGSAAQVAAMMYNATKVRGIFENMPEAMRGVFWMKGNAMAEELTVMQHSMWFPEEKLLVQPQAPFSWAWPGGKPKDAPFFGQMYSDDESTGLQNGFLYMLTAPTNSYRFSNCSDGGKISAWPLCNTTSSDPMAYAYMQANSFGSLTAVSNPGELVSAVTGIPSMLTSAIQGAFTLQALKGPVEGALFRRTCQWGISACAFLDFGSYDLVKILDGAGSPVQPYYQEFIDYMGDVPLIVWSGFSSDDSKKTLADLNRKWIEKNER
mmetsp:Transcript_32786/g.94362  ORF Transcript_32786/g.94362 Transcript_32786/m.94362 type:complete len:436 (-) Transcript_32786:211-1518(-)